MTKRDGTLIKRINKNKMYRRPPVTPTMSFQLTFKEIKPFQPLHQEHKFVIISIVPECVKVITQFTV